MLNMHVHNVQFLYTQTYIIYVRTYTQSYYTCPPVYIMLAGVHTFEVISTYIYTGTHTYRNPYIGLNCTCIACIHGFRVVSWGASQESVSKFYLK